MAQSLWLFGCRVDIVADHTTTTGKYDLMEAYFPAGTQTPLHRHNRYSEQLYVLQGELTVWVGENKAVLSTGESLLIPAGTPHMAAVLKDQPARVLVVAAPSGLARLVAAVGTLGKEEAPDVELAQRITAEIGDEVLGSSGTRPSI